ncbi:LAMI_0D11518g1_1 [Lachancea mirantina]|uniref:LAMI_0D11518g1_1 n=1 Tax=Lachancea mirantina TaxID=1230905 RepID=A0A1G4JF69_9SACH|nr:LAMI_0D11518g1_1 [Lachancea mirantina]
MPVTVKVKDYFENDDNGLWSWYLSNLRSGRFEELTGNSLKIALLRRFLNEQLLSATVPFNKKLLLVSIPDTVHENSKLLENFLRDYFHLGDLDHIQIRKLTDQQCYNHENHYLISDNLNNFNDRSFLEMGNRSHALASNPQIGPLTSNYQHSVLSGETGFDSLRSSVHDQASPAPQLPPSQVIMQPQENDGGYQLPEPSQSSSQVQTVSILNSSDDFEDSDAESSELMLNVGHSRKPVKGNNYHPLSKSMVSALSQHNRSDNFTSADTSVYSGEMDYVPYEGERLAHTITHEDDGSSSAADGDCISELSSVDHSLNSLSYQSEDSEDSHSLASIFPSISIADTFGRFRLVLQSILIQHPETRQLFTAIRQSNNNPTVADINDDWLLYDEKFSMGNLQMLALQDVLGMNRYFPKILFYTMVMITEETAPETQEYYPLSDKEMQKYSVSTSTISENTLKLQATLNSTLTNMQTYSINDDHNSIPQNTNDISDVQPYSPDYGDEYDDTDDGQVVPLYAATRTNSKSSAHRSIRTINSIGDWAFRHDMASKNALSKVSTAEDYHFSDDRVKKTMSKSSSKHGLSRIATLGSLNTVERSKSTPLPTILKTFSSVDDEVVYLKKRVEKFKRKKKSKKKPEANCIIM